MDLKDIRDPGHWHIAIAIAGLAITIAAIAAGNKPMVLSGLGMIAFGVGEMKNHPYQEVLFRDEYGRINGKISGHLRQASVFGMILDVIGVGLFAVGLLWFVFQK